jgi:hypothetical protein
MDILRDRYSFPHASVVASVDGASLFIAVVNQADAMEGPRFSHDGFTGASTCVR